MAQQIVEDLEAAKAWIAQQPLCQWAAAKSHALATGGPYPNGPVVETKQNFNLSDMVF